MSSEFEAALEIEVLGVTRVPLEEIERLLALALASAGIDAGHVAVEFVSAERISELNAAHRGEDIGKPNIGINYDPGNVIHYGDVRPENDLPGAVDKVIHMHVKDQIGGAGVWNFPTVGTGEVNFPALFKTLAEAGFDGPYSIEIEFQGEPWPALEEVDRAMMESYEYVRKFVPNER